MSNLISDLNANCDDLKVTLETLIDNHGLSYVLSTMAQICYEKADHVSSNWQDKELGKEWDKAGNRIDTAESKISKYNLP